jgi:hexosaminidase
METPLSVRGYERLREVPHRSDVLHPLAGGARELVEAMVDDVLALLPDTRLFHLGGDEAWSFGTHPETAAYIAEHGKGALYLHHVGPILDRLNAREVRPILWHDMMVEWDDAALDALAARADLCCWGYRGHPDTTGGHFKSAHIERFAAHGIGLWGGTAYKGADGHNVDLPVPATRRENALAWAEVAARYGFRGVFATAWSRYSTQDTQCEPIDAALDLLFDVGVCLHDGQPPAGGLEACVAALRAIGEGDRFAACRAAMAALSAVRAAGWQTVAHLRECLVTATLDARRRGAGVFVRRARDLATHLQRADAIADQTRAAFAGLLDPLWIERYLAERIEPLREEFGALAPRIQALDPEGFAATR